MSITIFGIPNCDTVKKAREFFKAQGVACDFVDFKKQGVPADRLDFWINALGWQPLLNRQGGTWRALDEVVKASVTDATSVAVVMTANSSCIKRPVVEWGGGVVTVGFDEAHFDQLLSVC